MPPDRRAAIFEDFEQGDGSNARHYEGTGLGLAIAKRIVALMGGELTLADNPGGGSIFAFAVALPAARERAGRIGAEGARRPSRADRRQFAVRGAGDRRPAGRGGRDRRARRRARRGPRRRWRAANVPISSSSTARSASNRPTASPAPRAPPARRRALVLFSPFERRAFGPVSLSGFDGWLVKPVRARSLYERLASEFAPAATPAPPTAAPARPPRPSQARAARRRQRHQRSRRAEGAAPPRLRGRAGARRRTRRRVSPSPRRAGRRRVSTSC